MDIKEEIGFVIPERFNIMGKTITVKYDPALHTERRWVGMNNRWEDTINLLPNNASTLKSQTSIEQVFWHETAHCILDAIGEEKLSENEDFCTRFGNVLHQVVVSYSHPTSLLFASYMIFGEWSQQGKKEINTIEFWQDAVPVILSAIGEEELSQNKGFVKRLVSAIHQVYTSMEGDLDRITTSIQ